MSLPSYTAKTLLLLLLTTASQLLADCGAIDPSYVAYGGTGLKVDSGVSVNGNRVSGRGYALQSNGQLVSKSPAFPGLDPSSFPDFKSGTSLKYRSGKVAEGTYDTIAVVEKGSLTFATVDGTYYIKQLYLDSAARVTFAPGIYFIEEMLLKEDSTLNISPSGDVRIYVKKQLKTESESRVNSGGGVTSLQIYTYDAVDIELGEKASFTGLIYAPYKDTEIQIKGGGAFHGMVLTQGVIGISEIVSLTLTAADQSEIKAISTCLGTTPPTGDAFSFNCVETGADALNGHLYTKLVNSAFGFDVIALRDDSGNGIADAVETDYASDADRYVAVELVDSSAGRSCSSYPKLSSFAAQRLIFSSTDQGRKSVSGLTVSQAYRSVRCRITDKSGATSVSACSADPFSIRPQSVTVTPQLLNNSGSSGEPMAKAGSVFTLNAATVAGYDGQLTIDGAGVEAHAGAISTGSISGAFNAADPTVGSAVGNSFIYDEVGNFRFLAEAVYDDAFTLVDQNGDCTAGFANSQDANGKLGCKFGNSSLSSWIGRFTPDHFSVTIGAHGLLQNSCASGNFSYAGEAIPWQRISGLEQTPEATITAWNALGSVTHNYTGNYDKLDLDGIDMPDINSDSSVIGAQGSAVGLNWALGGAFMTNNGDSTIRFSLGGDTFTYARGLNERITPFMAGLQLQIRAVTDADGVVATRGIPANFIPAGGVEVRYGRLLLKNAHGTDRLNLSVPLLVEYYDGANGFRPNTDDSCTSGLTLDLFDSDIKDKDSIGSNSAIFAAASVAGTDAAADLSDTALLLQQPPVNADFNLNLQAAGAGFAGSVKVRATAPTWLQFNWDGSGDSDPVSKATFGVYNRPGSAIIYLREAP